MITAITEANRQDIVDIIKSVFVCLKLLLDEQNIEAKINRYTKNSRSIKSKEDIVTNILEIISNDDFAVCRVHVPKILEEHQLFKTSLSHSQALNPTATKLVSELIVTIRNCELDFIEQLRILINEQDDKIKQICEELINYLVRPVGDTCYTDGTLTYNNNGYYNHSHNHHNHHHHHHHNNLNFIFAALYNYKKRIGNAIFYYMPPVFVENVYNKIGIPTIIEHGFAEARSLFWTFASRAKASIKHLGASCIGDRKHETQVEVVDEDERRRRLIIGQ